MTSDRVEWLQLERAVGLGEPVYTRAEVSELTDAAPEMARRLWRSLGFPDAADHDRIFTGADADMLRVAAALAHEGAVAPEVAAKHSGIGVENGPWGLESFQQLQVLHRPRSDDPGRPSTRRLPG